MLAYYVFTGIYEIEKARKTSRITLHSYETLFIAQYVGEVGASREMRLFAPYPFNDETVGPYWTS